MHILLKVATRRPYRGTPEIPASALYDVASGYWTLEGRPLVRTEGLQLGALSSKKNDIETGEDQKGE